MKEEKREIGNTGITVSIDLRIQEVSKVGYGKYLLVENGKLKENKRVKFIPEKI